MIQKCGRQFIPFKNLSTNLVAHILFGIIFLHLILHSYGSSIDLTTEYTVISKSLPSITTKGTKTKTAPSSLTLSGSATSLRSASSSFPAAKSYVTAPVIRPTTPKVTKRAGLLSDLKLKKIFKDIKSNRSHEAISRNRQTNEMEEDFITDSSGHIPITSYRSGILPSSTYQEITSVSGSGPSAPYDSGQFEADDWRSDFWDRDYSKRFLYNNTRVQHIEAECQDDYMKIRIGFNGTFSGLVYSAGYAYDPDCMYINGSGRDYYEFLIQLNRCGTLGKNALHEEKRKNPTNFMWNTVTVQYNPLIEEEFDEHFKVTCEYGYDFWKTVTFPFLDVEVATGNPVVFTLSPPECYMEIQNGYGIGGPRVTGPVHVGDPLTLIIHMRSKYDGFDIVVNDCYAHNGANKRIQLIDDFGCPVDDKLISRFRGTWSDAGVYETQVYAYMKTFRFTGSPALYIECDVRMCHGRCPSQPCHWRNLKTVTKREVTNSSDFASKRFYEKKIDINSRKDGISLSENVNLFQSLRVLQEGENDESETYSTNRTEEKISYQTCLKTSTISAVLATFSIILCILFGLLMVTCARLRYRIKESSLYETYITHKGQMD